MAATFDQVELYRHTSSLEGKTRAWCAANATKIYEGTAETFGDTGLTAATTYYYRLFAKYEEGGSGGGLYQSWSGYPDSPVLTSEYPYQIVFVGSGITRLIMSTTPFYRYNGSTTLYNVSFKKCQLIGGVWGAITSDTGGIEDISVISGMEANAPIYTDATLTTTYFAQTTPPAVEPTITYSQGISASEMTDVAPALYQKWAGYPDSPVLTSAYPYQFIVISSGVVYLITSTSNLYRFIHNTDKMGLQTQPNVYQPIWVYNGIDSWNASTSLAWMYNVTNIIECNTPIYTDATLTTVYFAKTTA